MQTRLKKAKFIELLIRVCFVELNIGWVGVMLRKVSLVQKKRKSAQPENNLTNYTYRTHIS